MRAPFDLDNFHRLYRVKKKETGNSAAAVRIALKPVAAKTVRVLTHVAAESQGFDFTKIRLGINNSGTDYYLDELQTVVADELCVSRSDILLGEGDSFFVEFTGTDDDALLVMTCNGWEQKLT